MFPRGLLKRLSGSSMNCRIFNISFSTTLFATLHCIDPSPVIVLLGDEGFSPGPLVQSSVVVVLLQTIQLRTAHDAPGPPAKPQPSIAAQNNEEENLIR